MKSIKVFLVEDEYIIREGIRDGVDWSANSFEFVGDAPDGELALKQIREKKPDIVITDICMPFMDGLELSRHIKEELPDTDIIVLSGHEEFSYAKECISIGVSDYLLKPISREELLKKVNELAESIREKASTIGEIEGSGLSSADRDKLMDFLRFGKQEEIDDFMKWFTDLVGQGAMKSQVFRQYVTMDLFLAVTGYLDEIEAGDDIKNEIRKKSEKGSFLATYEYTVKYIRELLLAAIEARTSVRNTKQSEVVDKVLRYVHDNYKDEELSLNQVAEYAGFSANHLSTVFHQEYGQSFVKYLTDYRMNKAKKLLVETNMRQSEICYEVGYKDPHYFSSIFKKTQGLTPTQYREGQRL